jgi:hypothetical protein
MCVDDAWGDNLAGGINDLSGLALQVHCDLLNHTISNRHVGNEPRRTRAINDGPAAHDDIICRLSFHNPSNPLIFGRRSHPPTIGETPWPLPLAHPMDATRDNILRPFFG